MRLDEAGMDAYTDRFDRDALRVETRTFYVVPSDGGNLPRYLAGEPGPDPAVTEPWHAWIRAQLARGATVRRLRVLHGEPGDYLRFEMEWGYLGNAAAGEDIRVISDTWWGLDPVGELWVLDDERVARMNYDAAGRFLHADVVDDDEAARIVGQLHTAWRLAEPFTEWWARHPEYHRVSRRERRSA